MQIQKDVVSKKLDGEEIVLKLQTGTYYGLNDSGTFLFELLKKGSTQNQLIAAASEYYQVEKISIEPDIKEFISELDKSGLIKLV